MISSCPPLSSLVTRVGMPPPPPLPCGFGPWSRGPCRTEEARVAALLLASGYHCLYVGPPSGFHAGQHERVLGAGGIQPARRSCR
jgi:hypothetical protein